MDMFDRGDFDQGFSNINVFLTLNCEDDEFQGKHDCPILAVQTKSKKQTAKPHIYARTTIDGKYTEISTGKKVNPASWNLHSKQMIRTRMEVKLNNQKTAQRQTDVERIFYSLQTQFAGFGQLW